MFEQRQDFPRTIESASAGLIAFQDNLKFWEASLPKRIFYGILIWPARIALSIAYRIHLLNRFGRVEIKSAVTKFADSHALSAPAPMSPPQPQTLSALICNYNHARYLPDAIDAVLAQRRLPDELIIMDDGSTDDSSSVLQRYEHYSWIKIVRKTKNEGYIKGINDLTALARGDFIHRGTSDDYMLPNFVSDLMEQAERYPKVGIVSGKMSNATEGSPARSVIGINGWSTGYKSPLQFRRYLEMSDPTCTLAPSTIFRREVVNELGRWRADLDIWDVSFTLQLAALRYGAAYVDAPVYTWVHRPAGWTRTTNKNAEKVQAMFARYYELMRSKEFKEDFGTVFPDLWLRANFHLVAETQFETMVKSFNFLEIEHSLQAPENADSALP